MPELAVTRVLVLLAAAVGAVLVLTGCDGSPGQHAATTAAAAPAATVRTATCDTWRNAPTAQKWRLVRGMRDFFGGQVDSPGMRGQVLPNRQALRLFDSYCNQLFAGAFSLYRIYGNAAAFTVPEK